MVQLAADDGWINPYHDRINAQKSCRRMEKTRPELVELARSDTGTRVSWQYGQWRQWAEDVYKRQDWNDVYRTDPDPEQPLKRGRQLNVMLTGDEYEMLCRAAFKLGIARSAWVRERVYALLCRSYADELSPLTDASIRDNATMLLKELKTKDAGR